MNIGLETYTVRAEQKKSLEKAYLPLMEMGISELELARIDFTEQNARTIGSLTEEYGIKPVSIQVKPKYVFGDVGRIAAFCELTGCKNVVISMLPFDVILGREDRFYSFISTLDGFVERYAGYGLTLGYHHHNWEYVRLSNGRTRMQEILSLTGIRIVNDTYWTARCGVDPARQILELGDRLLGIHLRDLTFRKRFLSVLPTDTYVGGGVIDFRSVLRAARETSCRYAVIEQNSSSPYDDIRRSIDYLRKIKEEL